MEKKTVHEVQLRALSITDFPEVRKWSLNPQFCAANEWPLYREESELRNWWQRCVEMDAPKFLRLGIDYRGRLIGYVDLAEQTETSAELGIAIGDSSLWQQGLGTKAAQLGMAYASKQLGIRQMTAETHIDNLRAQKMLERLGFDLAYRTDANLNYIKKEMPN